MNFDTFWLREYEGRSTKIRKVDSPHRCVSYSVGDFFSKGSDECYRREGENAVTSQTKFPSVLIVMEDRIYAIFKQLSPPRIFHTPLSSSPFVPFVPEKQRKSYSTNGYLLVSDVLQAAINPFFC